MIRLLTSLLLFLLAACLSGQTVIDLKRGGGVRAKTVDDYRRNDSDMDRRVREDSIAYNDCLTRAFNALYRDSLDQAEELLNNALSLRPAAPSNYIVRHYLARISMARGRYADAVQRLTALLRERPEDREVRSERASCYIESSNPQAALEDCNVLSVRPRRPSTRMPSSCALQPTTSCAKRTRRWRMFKPFSNWTLPTKVLRSCKPHSSPRRDRQRKR